MFEFETTTFAPLLVSRRHSQRKSQFETTNQNMSNHIDMLLLKNRDLVHHRTNVSICFDNPTWQMKSLAKCKASAVRSALTNRKYRGLIIGFPEWL